MIGITWFLAISFGLAWGTWELAIRSGVSVLSWQFELYALPGAFAPAIAAIIVRKWITREGFGDSGLRLNLNCWRYYLAAWLYPLVVVAAIAAEASLLGIATPDFSLSHQTANLSPAGPHPSSLLVVPQLMLTAVIMTPVFWGEEFGWRGYLQQRIFLGRPVAAAAVTGAIWAVWHFPLTLRGYNFPDHPLLGTLLFVPFTMLAAYIFGWLMRRSGSIWVPSLAHAATNTIGGISLLWFAGASPTLLGFGGPLTLLPLFAIAAWIYWSNDRSADARSGDPAPASS